MDAITNSSLIFVCVFGAALAGMFLRALLPEHHLSGDSKDTVKLGTGLVGSMVALILGLLVASAKSSYDEQKSELIELSANVVLLDRLMAHFGPETKEVRDMLRQTLTSAIDRLWAPSSRPANSAPNTQGGEWLYDRIHQLVST